MADRYSWMNECIGKVIGKSENGIFLKLDDGEVAYNRQFGSLEVGTEVLCTVLSPENERRRARIAISSVYYEAA